MKLNEKALRKDSFTEGAVVKLADQQEWTFPKPTIELLPIITEGKAIFGPARPSFGQEYWELFETYAQAENSGETMAALLNLAIYIIRKNYDISDEDVVNLFPFVYGDDENSEMWGQIADVAMGNGSPKR